MLDQKTWADAFTVLGHLSFLITFLSYAQRDIIKLRLLAVASLSIGLVYNSWVHINMPPGQDLWPVIIWLSLFLAQNIYLAVRSIRDQIEVRLSPHSRKLLAHAMPFMHSKDWDRLQRMATVELHRRGDVLLNIGDSTSRVFLLASGEVEVTRQDRDGPLRRGPGELWGEITYIMGERDYDHSPSRMTVCSDTAEVWSWSYEQIGQFCLDERSRAALYAAFVRAAGLKHGLRHGGTAENAQRNISDTQTGQQQPVASPAQQAPRADDKINLHSAQPRPVWVSGNWSWRQP